MTHGLRLLIAVGMGVAVALPLAAQQDPPVVLQDDSLSIKFVDAELSTVVQALGRHLDRPLAFGGLGSERVTLETPRPVPKRDAAALLRGILQSHDYELVADSGMYRVRRREQLGASGARTRFGAPAQDPAPVQLWVIRLRHARAADVAATVNALYGRAGALGELGSSRSTLSDELRRTRIPPMEDGGAEPASAAGGRIATLEGDVTIVPDAGTNSLLMRASSEDFQLIEAAVQELDLRPLQVLIEVLIAEVRRDRSFAFGLDLGLDSLRMSGSHPLDVAGSVTGLGLGDFVIRVMNVGGLELDATLRAAAGRGDVSIVSRPVLLAANNQTAHILVGSQRPFVQVSRSLPTDIPTRDQVIQYRDVGTQLTVHPTISGDGYVMLEVTQEVNAATTETAFDAPVISTRAVQTRLLVRDGQTVALGGLTDSQRDVSKRGIPILSAIPLIGGLFGSASRRTSGTELLLFITPRVIRTDEDAHEITDPLKERAERVKP